MITTRAKITAGAATLIVGTGLTLVLLTGNAGATAPAPTPNEGQPNATAAAPAAEQAARGNGPVVRISSVAPGVKIAGNTADKPTATVWATPPAARPGK
ncbi:hypothetical protein SAMN04515671_3493 [Nakamurella panacisegetis]|uniref:Uncharacterized protein n=1 Tax=Nakamurella panacisegetis TaxID=1090615 RepID=A0A1H0RBV2_9ACTN|nr:hypothetical protein [Nakamurella panacisegetis]SDP27092.1 hypothetical protein SAMN04515671_3493 [Nakamurella panacisegetis]